MKTLFPALKEQIESMKCNGIPIFVKSPKQRSAAHRYAVFAGMEVSTRRRQGQTGYEIYRTR